jgi:hypothetical protein
MSSVSVYKETEFADLFSAALFSYHHAALIAPLRFTLLHQMSVQQN